MTVKRPRRRSARRWRRSLPKTLEAGRRARGAVRPGRAARRPLPDRASSATATRRPHRDCVDQLAVTRTLGGVARQPGTPSRRTRTGAPTGSASASSSPRRPRSALRVLQGRQVGRDAVRWAARARHPDARVGRREADRQARDGEYEAVVEATDAIATSRSSLPFAPTRARRRCGSCSAAPLQDLGQRAGPPRRFASARGASSTRRRAPARRACRAPRLGLVRTVAWDAAGNVSSPASER